MHVKRGGGEPSDFGVISAPRTSWQAWESHSEGIPEPLALPRSLEADPSPGLQSIPKGHQVWVTVVRL